MNTLELKSNLYNLIDKTKDIDILQAIKVLLEKQLKSVDEMEYNEELADDYELTEEHKKILDQRLESYKKNPENLVSWNKVKEIIKK